MENVDLWLNYLIQKIQLHLLRVSSPQKFFFGRLLCVERHTMSSSFYIFSFFFQFCFYQAGTTYHDFLVFGACRLNGKSLICLWHVWFGRSCLLRLNYFFYIFSHSLKSVFLQVHAVHSPSISHSGKVISFFCFSFYLRVRAIETVKIINISISPLSLSHSNSLPFKFKLESNRALPFPFWWLS